jgi:hypothetical protein
VGLARFSLPELQEILTRQFRLFFNNSLGFRDLALEEIKNTNEDILSTRHGR